MQGKLFKRWQKASGRGRAGGELLLFFYLLATLPGELLLWPHSLAQSSIVWRGKDSKEFPPGTPTVPEPPSSVMTVPKEMSHITNSS